MIKTKLRLLIISRKSRGVGSVWPLSAPGYILVRLVGKIRSAYFINVLYQLYMLLEAITY